jgi:hypothetical protein
MEFLIQQILAGLAAGGIYASLGLALVMIYRATHLINFAQGEMATFSTYIALKLIRAGLPYWAAFVVTVIVSFALGVTIERVIVRPVERAPHLTVVIVLVGIMIVFNSMSGWLFGTTLEMFPSPFASSALFGEPLNFSSRGGVYHRSVCGAGRCSRVLPLHADRVSHEGRRSERNVQQARRNSRWLDACPGLGSGRGNRFGSRDDGCANRLLGSQHDGRNSSLCFRRRTAGRDRESDGRGPRRLYSRCCREPDRHLCNRSGAQAFGSADSHNWHTDRSSSGPVWCNVRRQGVAWVLLLEV